MGNLSFSPEGNSVTTNDQVERANKTRKDVRSTQRSSASNNQFTAMVEKAARKIRISKHAKRRLREAGVELEDGRKQQIVVAMKQLAEKGARESLVLLQNVVNRNTGSGNDLSNLALIVNPNERTVITAVEGDRMESRVFTNIDSAIIVDEEPGTERQGGQAPVKDHIKKWQQSATTLKVE